MILTLLLIFLITSSGAVLTYLYEEEDSLLVRLAAGNVVGSALFGTAGFLLACLFGLSAGTVLAALAIALLPLAFLAREDCRTRLKDNLGGAQKQLEGADFGRILKFSYYAFIFILLWFFFDRAMLETKDGIYTGGSQNLGDLPFHLGAIFSFTEGNNFPPENPSYAGAKFTYPFLVDFVTACFVETGASVRSAMLVQNALLGFSLVVLLEKFTARLTGSRLAGKIAPPLLFFSGGLGFLEFFKHYRNGAESLTEILWNLREDYTIGEKLRWGNSLIVLFLTQRGLLFGMPLTIIALTKIWEIFSSEKEERDRAEAEKTAETDETSGADETFHENEKFFSPFLIGLLAGTLVLIHVHSLAALFVVCAFLFFFRMERWRAWIAFGAGVSIVAVPELVWSLTGSASNLAKFIEPHFGWDAKDENFIKFWAKNIGLFAPVLLGGLILLLTQKSENAATTDEQNPKPEIRNPKSENLLIFYLPFAFLFLLSNTVKLAPWEWDNIKVLIYWFVGSLPIAALALAWAWRKNAPLKIAAIVCFVVLTLSGALDVWRTVSRQVNYKVFDRDAVRIAESIKQKTAPGALFLNAPTYNSAVVLSGRRSLMRYSGHLSSYGIDYEARESEVRKIYAGDALADRLLQKNNIEYVIISPEETANVTVNEEFFYKFPLVAEAGAYKVFKVK
ncbi:MAG TPA: hypothetical protein VIL74_11955 [Pyrinomonadaceae bacterium]|jgi:hypothetical protein